MRDEGTQRYSRPLLVNDRCQVGNMTHVLIATPTMGGVVKSLYATTLVKTISAIKDVGWSVDFVMLDGSYVSGARNYFANVSSAQKATIYSFGNDR